MALIAAKQPRTKDLRVHHDLPGVYRQISIVETPIKDLLGGRLVCWVVVWRQVFVRQGLGGRDTSAGVKDEHLFEQVERERIGIGEFGGEGDLFSLW